MRLSERASPASQRPGTVSGREDAPGRSPLALAFKLLFALLLAATLTISNRIDLLVAGSDATSFLIAPSPLAQAAASVLAVACLLIPVRPRWRLAPWIPALAFATLATHRVLIDRNHGEVRDLYALAAVQTLPFDPAQEGGFRISPFLASITLRPAGSADTLSVVTPPLLGLDRSRLAALEN